MYFNVRNENLRFPNISPRHGWHNACLDCPVCHPCTIRDVSGPDWEQIRVQGLAAVLVFSFEHIAMSYRLLVASPCQQNTDAHEEFILTAQTKVSDRSLSGWGIINIPIRAGLQQCFRRSVCSSEWQASLVLLRRRKCGSYVLKRTWWVLCQRILLEEEAQKMLLKKQTRRLIVQRGQFALQCRCLCDFQSLPNYDPVVNQRMTSLWACQKENILAGQIHNNGLLPY